MPLGGFWRGEEACTGGWDAGGACLVGGKGLQGHGSVAKGMRPRFPAVPKVILVLCFLQALLLVAACRPGSVGFV